MTDGSGGVHAAAGRPPLPITVRLPAWTDDLRGTVRYPEAFEPLA